MMLKIMRSGTATRGLLSTSAMPTIAAASVLKMNTREYFQKREGHGVFSNSATATASSRQRAFATSHRSDARPGGGPDKSKWKKETEDNPKIDNASSVAKMRANAENGDVVAQYTLGAALMRGQLGLTKNTKEASGWLRKAAEAGNTHAQFSFALLLSEGDGVEKDLHKAVHYWTAASESNLAAAQFHLGCCYEKGAGVPQDLDAAALLFAKAVAQQHEAASLKLALCFIAGRGVQQDYNRAVNLLSKPANNGVAEAQFVLGYLYLSGEGGVKQDVPHALSMIESAGKIGFHKATWYLGICYLNGHAVTKDEQKASGLFQVLRNTYISQLPGGSTPRGIQIHAAH
jgi:TPR repeat protein